MPWKGEHGFLEVGGVRPAGGALIALAEERLPVTLYVGEPSQWWSVAGTALVARASRTLASTLLLYDQRCDLDAATLTRTLFEQLVTFAYLAYAPNDRLLPFESADHKQSDQIVHGVRALGYEMHDGDGWDTNLLGPMPKPLNLTVAEYADHADQEWPDVPETFFRTRPRAFRLLYETIYRAASRAVHGKAYVTGPFVDLGRQPTVVVRGEERPTGVIGYEWAVMSFAFMLLVAERTLGWPTKASVIDALLPYLPSGTDG